MPARAAACSWVLALWRSRSMICTSASVFMGALLTRAPCYKSRQGRLPRSTVLIVVTYKSNYRSTGGDEHLNAAARPFRATLGDRLHDHRVEPAAQVRCDA